MSTEENSELPRLDRVRHGLNVLRRWLREEPKAVSHAAGEVTPLVWAELKERGVWDGLVEHDQAAVHRMLACGRVMASETISRITFDTFQRHRDTLLREVAYFATMCEPHTARWPEVSPERRLEESRRAVDYRIRFEALPEAWQAEVLGRLNPVSASHFRPNPGSPPSLEEALAEAERHRGSEAPKVHRNPWDTSVSGEDLLNRLSRLPYPGWHTEVFREMAVGTGAASVVGQAAMSINLLNNVYGVRLAWAAAYYEKHSTS